MKGGKVCREEYMNFTEFLHDVKSTVSMVFTTTSEDFPLCC